MIRVARGITIQRGGIPRESGDDPYDQLWMIKQFGYSPRERG